MSARVAGHNRAVAFWALLLLSPAVVGCQSRAAERVAAPIDTSFSRTVERLSEPAGYFDTDNLISNESSYLHVLPRLAALGTRGGAYIGVGPDQNYSYIAAVRPEIAYVIDVRRDNLLQHLMFKALFERSNSRLEFLCRWLGRRPPADLAQWRDRPIDSIIGYLDRTPADTAFARAEGEALVASAMRTGVPLSQADVSTITRFHSIFVGGGLGLQFTSFGRAPRPNYPTLRQLVLERDDDGRQASYLVRDEDWRFIKSLHGANRIVPVVGNLAGTAAVPAIARDVRGRGLVLSALYTSNVEFYVWNEGQFAQFASNVAALPRDGRSAIIRSYFGRQLGDAPLLTARRGYASVQLLQPVEDFVRRAESGAWRSYRDVVTLGAR